MYLTINYKYVIKNRNWMYYKITKVQFYLIASSSDVINNVIKAITQTALVN